MKCPICGEDYVWNINSKSCPNNHNCEDFIKEIERLKSANDKLVKINQAKASQYVEDIKRLKKEIKRLQIVLNDYKNKLQGW